MPSNLYVIGYLIVCRLLPCIYLETFDKMTILDLWREQAKLIKIMNWRDSLLGKYCFCNMKSNQACRPPSGLVDLAVVVHNLARRDWILCWQSPRLIFYNQFLRSMSSPRCKREQNSRNGNDDKDILSTTLRGWMFPRICSMMLDNGNIIMIILDNRSPTSAESLLAQSFPLQTTRNFWVGHIIGKISIQQLPEIWHFSLSQLFSRVM